MSKMDKVILAERAREMFGKAHLGEDAINCSCSQKLFIPSSISEAGVSLVNLWKELGIARWYQDGIEIDEEAEKGFQPLGGQ